MRYDVIIAGASFAGLTVAQELKGKVLLIDRKTVGTLPTSACATLYELLKEIGGEDAAIQVGDKVKFSTVYGETKFRLKRPFCTFNYSKLCQNLLDRFQGEFLKANVLDLKENTVITDKGDFEAPILVDCTGWRAALASKIDPGLVVKRSMGFGLETEIALEVANELHFLFDPQMVKGPGYAWVFPVGGKARIGLGNYTGNTNILDTLKQFVADRGGQTEEVHGGFMPYSLRKAVVGPVFLVGDSAGQIIPVTGEGIRQSVYFGIICGRVIQKVLDHKINLDEAKEYYSNFIQSHRRIYQFFSAAQGLWSISHPIIIELIARTFRRRPLFGWAQNRFFSSFDFTKDRSVS